MGEGKEQKREGCTRHILVLLHTISKRHGEKNLWFEFKKRGNVREVFIARNKNKSGRRYGFVRFKWVNNARKLERQLDNLVLEGLKLHLNLLKHGREWKPTKKVNKEHQHKEEVVTEKLAEREKVKERR